MTTSEINTKAKKLKKLRNTIAEMNKEVQQIEAGLKAEMLALGVNEMTVGLFKLHYTKVKSTRFDSGALKTAQPDLYIQFLKPCENYRFCIT